MLIRTPMRIDLVGDGSDLLFYCSKHNGAVVNMAIDKYVTVWKEGKRIKNKFDVPQGTGLGSSGSLHVALTALENPSLSNWRLVEQSWEAEKEEKKSDLCGGQDQAAAVFGGLRIYRFQRGQLISCEKLPKRFDALSSWLVCFRIGGQRVAIDYLQESKEAFERGFGKVIYDLLSRAAEESIMTQNIEEFSHYVMLTWRLKNLLGNKSTPEIESKIEQGLEAGATAAKLSGAGGAGYLVFLCPPEKQTILRTAISLPELKIKQDNIGLVIT